MENLLNTLKSLLQKDERLTSEGELLKNKIVELALKLDKDLIKLLLSDKKMEKVFFADIDGTLVFDKDKFLRFVSSKDFLPDSFTAFKNKIGLAVGGDYLSEKKEVVLSWPYKDCVLEGGMTKEDQKRDEIFWNETLAPDEITRLLDPKVFTNAKRIDKNGEHPLCHSEAKPKNLFRTDENRDIKDNLIIKGNNLLALHSLKKRFAGKVKLIYIDPPYNTGGAEETFTYNNNFNHSTWLTFMKNRLEVAKDFLREDGFIAITIDHNELFYLGTLADQIFGRDNRLGIISVVHKPEGRQFANFFSPSNEFMLVYTRNKSSAQFEDVVLSKEKEEEFDQKDEKGRYKLKNFIRLTDGKYSLRKNKPEGYYPVYVSKDLKRFSLEKKEGYNAAFPITDKGVERVWKTFGDTFMQKIEEGVIVAKRENGKIVLYEKLRPTQVLTTHWIKKQYHAYHFGTKLLEGILGRKDFSYPKSLYAVLDALKIMTSGDDIVLDFFAGSGTTGHAVLELNKEDGGSRKFILVEQLEEHIKVCIERIQKVMKNNGIADNFVYLELMKWNENFVDKIRKAKTKEELKKLWEMMKEKAFLSYKVDMKAFDEHAKDFADLSVENQKKFLLECLNKNHLYVNYSEIEDGDYGVSKEDKRINKGFYP